jgi:uncharacterized protein YerC
MLLIKKAYAIRAFNEILAVGEQEELKAYLADICEIDESYIQLIREGTVVVELLYDSIRKISSTGIAEMVKLLKKAT